MKIGLSLSPAFPMKFTILKILGTKGLGILKALALLAAGCLLAVLVWRSYKAFTGDPLELWHTYRPAEMSKRELAKADWQTYVEHEAKLMESVRENVTRKIKSGEADPANRYHPDSPLNPDRFAVNWNRSFVMLPQGVPQGAVVLLHGLTDSPYSMRHVAALYRDRGFAAVGIRLPGHGTVPAGLVGMDWEDWDAATKLAVREARRLSGPDKPLHLVGYSNGGALALKYALDSMEDPGLVRPTQIILYSPMIGITEMARFTGVAGWPAVFPPFARAAWLGIMPEFNPFKYNSFPVNGGRQSSLMTRTLQPRLARYSREGRLAGMPPVLTFQSVMDFTTSARAVVQALHENLPDNGSELVLFDLNRNASYGPLLRADTGNILSSLLPTPPRHYAVSLITNRSRQTREVAEVRVAAGKVEETRRDLELSYPPGVFSLSHIALPFPIDDSLYGIEPQGPPEFGVHLGAIFPRGERNTLIVSTDALVRMSCNPFHPLVMEKIDAVIPSRDDETSPAGSHNE
jgi:alpha-beta hydrolase superfamily lysophospholipase